MIRVNGRGWHGGQIRLTPAGDGLHVRVDDDFNPEIWFEMFLPLDMLVNAVGCANALTAHPHYHAEAWNFHWGDHSPNALATDEIPPFLNSEQQGGS